MQISPWEMFKGTIHPKLIFHQDKKKIHPMDAYDGLKEENPNVFPHCWRDVIQVAGEQTSLTRNCDLNTVFLDSERSSSILKSSVIFYFLICAQQAPGGL